MPLSHLGALCAHTLEAGSGVAAAARREEGCQSALRALGARQGAALSGPRAHLLPLPPPLPFFLFL
eukprot:909617-Rhodomonas_salina.1